MPTKWIQQFEPLGLPVKGQEKWLERDSTMNITVKCYQDYYIRCLSSKCGHEVTITEQFIFDLREKFPEYAEGDEDGDYSGFRFTSEIKQKFVCSFCRTRGFSLIEGETEQEKRRKALRYAAYAKEYQGEMEEEECLHEQRADYVCWASQYADSWTDSEEDGWFYKNDY